MKKNVHREFIFYIYIKFQIQKIKRNVFFFFGILKKQNKTKPTNSFSSIVNNSQSQTVLNIRIDENQMFKKNYCR